MGLIKVSLRTVLNKEKVSFIFQMGVDMKDHTNVTKRMGKGHFLMATKVNGIQADGTGICLMVEGSFSQRMYLLELLM